MKTLPRNFLALFLSDIISRLLAFIATVYIARLLGVQGLGLLSYGAAFLTYALLFVNPGLTTIGAREIAKDTSRQMIIADILGLRLVLTFVVFIFFALGVYLIPGQLATKTIILTYLVSLFPLVFILEFVFQGRQEMHFIGISRLIQYIVYVLLLYVFLKAPIDIYNVPVYLFFGYIAATLFLLVVFFMKSRSMSIRFVPKAWHKILTMSMPVGFATIFNQVALYLPTVALGLVHSKVEVGLYSAAYKIVAMLLIIERVFHFVFFPVISRQYRIAETNLSRSFAFLVRLLFSITIPVAVCGIVLAGNIIYSIYGAEFSGSVIVLRILLLYFLITPINTIFGYGLVAIDQQHKFFRVIAYTAVISVVLIIALGYLFKASGVALALLSGETVGIILMNRQLKKHIDFKSLKQIIKPLIAALITGLVLYVFRQVHVLILVLAAVVIYLLVFYIIKGFSFKELSDFKNILTEK
jgi:O-antigen/teichoic acid export membrane protein